MARWLVKLVGEHFDLEEFPAKFPDGELYAIEKDGGVYLVGPEFERLNDARLVREHAKGAIEEMSSVISLLWPPFIKPSIDSVLHEDGVGGVSVNVPLVGQRMRSKTGIFIEQRPTEAQRLLRASRSTGHLRTAVLLWAFPDHAWWLLFRMTEEIEAHLKERKLGTTVANSGYCSNTERKRFRGSANSPVVSGLGSRHAAGEKKPPKNPMNHEDAKAFVKEMLEKALRDDR